jgi:hypothetical protein
MPKPPSRLRSTSFRELTPVVGWPKRGPQPEAGRLQRVTSPTPRRCRELGLGQGLFGTDVYLSDRPPLLPDFGDDAVAADVRIPIVQKMLVIQGMELTPLG